MADKSLDIVLRILTQQVGPQKAAEVVKQVKEETARATKAVKELTAAEKKAAEERRKAAIINREAGGVLNKTRQEMDASVKSAIRHRDITSQLALSKQNLNHALRGASRAFPLLRAAINPVTAGFAIVSLALAKWVQGVSEARAATASFREMNRPLAGEISAPTRELEAAADLWKQHTKLLTDATAAQRELTAATGDGTDKLKAAHAQTLKEISAREAADLAEVDAQLATGAIDERTAATRRARIKSDSGAAATDATARLDKDLLAAKEKELEELKTKLPALKDNAEARLKEFLALERTLSGLEREMANLMAEKKRREDWAAANRGSPPELYAANQAAIKSIHSRFMRTEGDFEAAREKMPGAKDALETARSELAQNTQATTAAQTFISNRPDTADHDRTMAGANRRRQMAEMIARQSEFSPHAGLLGAASAGADTMLSGGRVSSEQSAAMSEATKLLGLRGASQDKIVEILAKLNDKEEGFVRALQQIEKRESVQQKVP